MSEPAAFLSRITSALDEACVPYMLAGSFASSLHGAPRATQDIDVVVDPSFESLDRLLASLAGDDDLYLNADGAREEFKRRGQFNVIDGKSGWKADFIFRKARPFSRSELDRRRETTILGVRIFVASAEDTILSKLEWAKLAQSERQLSDVRGIIGVKSNALDLEYIEGWLDELGVRDLWDRVRQA